MRDKSGVSPVIATLLLVIIAVAAAIIVYAWTTMFTTMQTGRAGAIIATETVVKYDKTTPYDKDRYKYTFNVTVRNIGSTDVSITDVYLNGTKLTFATGSSKPNPGMWVIEGSGGWGDSAILQGHVGLVSFTACLRKGYPCTVRVVTSQGAYSDISFYPP